VKSDNYKSWPLTALLMLTLAPGVTAQQAAPKPEAQAVLQTGLLPVYGVDFTFDPAWVEGAQFPGTSAKHSNFGVNAVFQQVWNTLSASGFNVIRFPVDVRDGQVSANRVANLCVWAKNNNVKLVPVLVGAERGKPLGTDFSTNVSAFIKLLLAAMRGGDGLHLEAYAQILSYQIENEMNHAGLHGAMSFESAQLRLLQAASQLRKAEQAGLEETGLSATPLMVNASFDYELIKMRAMAGAPLSDDAYVKAYESLNRFLVELAASPDIDLIGVDWFAGSFSAGSAEKFSALLQSLTANLAGKQLTLTTGFSTGFRSSEEQKRFYFLAFANLADYRASVGVDSPFIGVFFREAVNSKDMNPEPPKPTLPSETVKWDWEAKSDELSRMWGGQSPSDDLAWWLKRVENNMGLLTLKLDPAGNATITAQLAQQSLRRIASSVSEANAAATEVPPSSSDSSANPAGSDLAVAGVPPGLPLDSDPSPKGTGFGNALKDRGQQLLLDVLDRVLNRLGSSAGDGSNSQDKNSGDENTTDGIPSGEAPDGSTTAAIVLENVRVATASPRACEQVSVSAVLRSQSANADASGLVVALLDPSGAALSPITDIAVGRNTPRPIELHWTPPSTGNYSISVQVSDANFQPIANAALDVSVTAGSATCTTGGVVSGGAGVGNMIVDPVIYSPVPLGSAKITAFSVGTAGQGLIAGRNSSVIFSMVNPYTRTLSNVKATLLVDGKAVQTRTVSVLLSQQSRSIVFANVPFQQAGRHEVKVALESGGAKPQMTAVTKQVQVSANAASSNPGAKTPGVVIPGGKPVRPVVPNVDGGGVKNPLGPSGTRGLGPWRTGGIRGIELPKPGNTRGTGPSKPGDTGTTDPNTPADPRGLNPSAGTKGPAPSRSGDSRTMPPRPTRPPDSPPSSDSRGAVPPKAGGARPSTGGGRSTPPPSIRPEGPRASEPSKSGGTRGAEPPKNDRNSGSGSVRPVRPGATAPAQRGDRPNSGRPSPSPSPSPNKNPPRVTAPVRPNSRP
jgi:hypothetical protein